MHYTGRTANTVGADTKRLAELAVEKKIVFVCFHVLRKQGHQLRMKRKWGAGGMKREKRR